MPQAYDTIIRNGYIVDGTGGAAFYGDLGIKGGRIGAIGDLRGASASEEIDAAGKIVAPGHVTQHAHYDAMMFWSPYCPNSGENGVTTIVNANCGFGFAPVRSADRERTMTMMETTEQIPVSHQKSALTWNWETFPQFLDEVRSAPKGVNILTYLPVNPLLIYVMGIDAAKSRKPTEDEMAQMHVIINEAMDAGALGISMSVMGAEGNTHVDFDGTPMPTDVMDHDTIIDLGRALAERGEGVIQMLTEIVSFGFPGVTERMAEMAKGSGARVVHNIFLTSDAMPGLVDSQLAWIDGLRNRGLDVTAQALLFHLWSEGGMRDLITFCGQLPVVREIVACEGDPALKALMQDPGFAQRFEEQYNTVGATSGASSFEGQTVIEVGPAAELQGYLGRTLADIAQERGRSVIETLLNLAVQSDLHLELKSALIASTDPKQAIRLMSHSAVSIGVTDGGAHTKSNTHGHYGTDLLVWLVRDEKLMTLEQMHHQLALKSAQALVIRDRGAILPGFHADLLIYDLNDLHVDYTRARIINDMPDGDWRRAVGAGGYTRILVNGVTTHVNDRPTGAMPGELVQVTRDRKPLFLDAAE